MIGQVGVESLPLMAPALALGAGAGVAGAGLAGAGAMTGAGSGYIEYTLAILDGLAKEGVDIGDAEAVEQAVMDAELMKRVEQRAVTRGAAIGAVDALAVLVAARPLIPRGAANRAISRVGDAMLQVGAIQPALGGSGEALAQVAAGDELRPGEIALEAAGEVIAAPGTIGVAAIADRRSQPDDAVAEDVAPGAPVPPDGTVGEVAPAGGAGEAVSPGDGTATGEVAPGGRVGPPRPRPQPAPPTPRPVPGLQPTPDETPSEPAGDESPSADAPGGAAPTPSTTTPRPADQPIPIEEYFAALPKDANGDLDVQFGQGLINTVTAQDSRVIWNDLTPAEQRAVLAELARYKPRPAPASPAPAPAAPTTPQPPSPPPGTPVPVTPGAQTPEVQTALAELRPLEIAAARDRGLDEQDAERSFADRWPRYVVREGQDGTAHVFDRHMGTRGNFVTPQKARADAEQKNLSAIQYALEGHKGRKGASKPPEAPSTEDVAPGSPAPQPGGVQEGLDRISELEGKKRSAQLGTYLRKEDSDRQKANVAKIDSEIADAKAALDALPDEAWRAWASRPAPADPRFDRMAKAVREQVEKIDLTAEGTISPTFPTQGARRSAEKKGIVSYPGGELTPMGREAVAYIQDRKARLAEGVAIDAFEFAGPVPKLDAGAERGGQKAGDVLTGADKAGNEWFSDGKVLMRGDVPRGHRAISSIEDGAKGRLKDGSIDGVLPQGWETMPAIRPVAVRETGTGDKAITTVRFDNGSVVNADYYRFAQRHAKDAEWRQADPKDGRFALVKDGELIGVVMGLSRQGEPSRAEAALIGKTPEAGETMPEEGKVASRSAARRGETVANTDKSGLAPPELIVRRNGNPFSSAKSAEVAAVGRRLETYTVREVEGGFAIEVPAGGAAQTGETMPETGEVGRFAPGGNYVGRRPQPETAAPRRRKPVSRDEALKNLGKALNVSIYTGRIRKRSPMLGFFRPNTEEIRLKNPADLETAIHEAAHLIDKRFAEVRRQWFPASNANKTVRDELRSVSYDQELLFEGFAEFVRLWATQPEMAEKHTPVFLEWWEGFLDRHPNEGKAIRRFRDHALEWFEQSAIDRARSKIGTPVDVNASLNSVFSRFRQSVTDDLHGIYRMERDLKGGIEPGGAYETARLIRGKAAVTEGVLLYGAPVVQDDGSVRFEGKGLNQILDPVASNLDDFLLYAVGRAARELAIQGRENLFSVSEINAMLALERPEFVTAFDEYQDWNNAILDFAESKGAIDPESRAAWKRAEYLPFHRVSTKGKGRRPPRPAIRGTGAASRR